MSHTKVKLLKLCEMFFSHIEDNQRDYLSNSQCGLLNPIADPFITVVFVKAAV